MSAASKRTLLKTQCSLRSLLAEQEVLPNAPGSAFCCHLAVRQLQAMSFISFHPLDISFPLFLLALRPDGLIEDCWWNGNYCRDHIDKHSSLWRALSLTELFNLGIFSVVLGSWQHQVLDSGLPGFLCLAWSENAVFSRACLLSSCRREVMINGKNSSVSFRLHDKIDWILKPYACSFCSILSLCFSFQNMSGIPAWIFFWLRPCLAAICAYCCCCFASLICPQRSLLSLGT